MFYNKSRIFVPRRDFTRISLCLITKNQIKALYIVKDNPNDHNHWWLAGGVFAGIVTSIVIFYAAVEIKENE